MHTSNYQSKREDELAAVATLRHGLGYGLLPSTRLSGSAVAVLHYNCFLRAIASQACRIRRAPCVGLFGDFSVGTPRCLVGMDPQSFTELKEALFVALETHKSEAGSFLEFSGSVASLRGDG